MTRIHGSRVPGVNGGGDLSVLVFPEEIGVHAPLGAEPAPDDDVNVGVPETARHRLRFACPLITAQAVVR